MLTRIRCILQWKLNPSITRANTTLPSDSPKLPRFSPSLASRSHWLLSSRVWQSTGRASRRRHRKPCDGSSVAPCHVVQSDTTLRARRLCRHSLTLAHTIHFRPYLFKYHNSAPTRGVTSYTSGVLSVESDVIDIQWEGQMESDDREDGEDFEDWEERVGCKRTPALTEQMTQRPPTHIHRLRLHNYYCMKLIHCLLYVYNWLYCYCSNWHVLAWRDMVRMVPI